MEEEKSATSFDKPEIQHEYKEAYDHLKAAGFGVRFIAILVDVVLVALSYGIIVGGIETIFRVSPHTIFFNSFKLIVFLIVMHSIILTPLHVTGQSVGKRIFKLKVVPTNGEYGLSYWRIILREIIGKYISMTFLGLGFLWMLFSKEKLCWHDSISKTRVFSLR